MNNFHKLDIYRLNLEKTNDVVMLEIVNSISWDAIKMPTTKKELKELVDYINKAIND